MNALALLYFMKIWGLQVRRIDVCGYGMDGKFHIHGKPAVVAPPTALKH